MNRILNLLLIIFTTSLFATEYWDYQKFIEFEKNKSRIAGPAAFNKTGLLRTHQVTPNYSYPFEYSQICQFLAQWQVLDPNSSDFGGMIEAESGGLGNVIQTDNTQEAIVSWCQYGFYTGDTLKYRANINAAWTYIMNFPAYDEEGSPGDHYYRDHNCAWGAWGVEWYERVYNDFNYTWYGDSCANYMAKHQLIVFTPQTNRNAFVTGWMAGNLYNYAIYRNNQAWKDSSLVMGNALVNWAAANPSLNLADFTWAMSSGTSVWGMFNSVFKEDVTAGNNWLQIYATYLPDYFDNILGGDYIWDSSWNVALINAYRSMYLHSGNNDFLNKEKVLTDTLLWLDSDDDGGIMANKNHPPTEDMSWVTSYLSVFGVDHFMQQSPDIDVGVFQIIAPDSNATYLLNDTLSVKCFIANYGKMDLQNVAVQLEINGQVIQSKIVNLDFMSRQKVIFENVYQFVVSGNYNILVKTIYAGDQNPVNDFLNIDITIPEFEILSGKVVSHSSGQGVKSGIKLYNETYQFQAVSDSGTGQYAMHVVPGTYFVDIVPEFPYASIKQDTLIIQAGHTNWVNFEVFKADFLLIDDDEGEDLENYYISALDEIISDPNSLIDNYYHWDVNTKGNFPAERILEMPWWRNIFWFTGNTDSTALTKPERKIFSDLMIYSGRICLTGKNIAQSLAGTPFLTDTLKVNYTGNSTYLPRFVYHNGSLSGGTTHKFTTWGGSGANNQFYDRDILFPIFPADANFFYLQPDSQVAGISVTVDNSLRLVFLGFGIEGIRDNYGNYNSRADIINLILFFFRLTLPIEKYPDINNIQSFEAKVAYPNPFNSAVIQEYVIPKAGNVDIRIYDNLGRLVKSVNFKHATAGNYKWVWNGFDTNNQTVSSGIYFIKISHESFSKLNKVILIK